MSARRAAGADGGWPLVDGMLELRVDGRPLRDEEIAGNLRCVFVGGTKALPKVVDLDRAVRHPSSFQWGCNVMPVTVTGAG